MSVRVRPGPFNFFATLPKQTFPHLLLRWYSANHRKLPWRETSDPYRILLSEVMLQQTQVKTVIPYYYRFLKQFPTFAALARAPIHRVLKAWEGLGYYSRARNLHALAKVVLKRKDKTLPSTYEELIEMPGIGRYTAGAVLSIAFKKDYPVVDGNVQRVLARYFGIREMVHKPEIVKRLWSLAEHNLPKGNASVYNQALMELGALICTPRDWRCSDCPLRKGCAAFRLNLQAEIPLKSKKPPVPHYHIGAGVIWKDEQLLISQRPMKGLLGGLWEFPGGKQEPGETLQECVRREIKEELDIDVKVGKLAAPPIDHAYSHFKITLHPHHCTYRSGQPKAIGVQDFRWVLPGDLKRFAFPAANQPIIQKILKEMV